jgi:succinate dehydrogenase/fumarate reductase flavoprotein subunit
MALDIDSMIIVSKACALAALAREESRENHTREDFPDSRPEWANFNHVVFRQGADIKVRREPLPQMPADMKALIGGK